MKSDLTGKNLKWLLVGFVFVIDWDSNNAKQILPPLFSYLDDISFETRAALELIPARRSTQNRAAVFPPGAAPPRERQFFAHWSHFILGRLHFNQ